MTRAYSLHRAAPVTALSGLGIVLTYLLAIPALGDQPTIWQIAGSLLVIASGILLALSSRPAPVSIRAPG
jgi:drug/metabolite transporter (DMT)-like permease